MSFVDSAFASGAPAGLLPPQSAAPLYPQVQPLQQRQSGLLGDIGGAIGGILGLPSQYLGALGGSLKNSAESFQYAHQQRQIQLQMMNAHMQQLGAIDQSLANNPQEQMIFRADPNTWIATQMKNRELATVPGGESRMAPGTPTLTAPLLGKTDANQFVTQTPDATVSTGAFPTIQKAGPGDTISPLAPVGPAGENIGNVANGLSGVPTGPGTPSPPPQGDLAMDASSAASRPTAGPRGIRNNNWGNVTQLSHGQQWAGQTGVDSGGYVQFATPQDGIKATITNLQAYAQHHGLNTVAGIISRWAPPSHNDTAAYIAGVSRGLGVDPHQPLDMSNPQVLNGLAHGIFTVENGAGALQAALSGAGSHTQSAAAGPAPTGLPTSLHGKTNQDIAPPDAQRMGLAPGRWQITPTGQKVQVSKPSDNDMKRLAALDTAVDTTTQLAQSMARFSKANEQAGTGLGYWGPEIHGHDINPLVTIKGKTDPNVGTMESEAAKQIFLVKNPDTGMRVFASELPIWAGSTQQIDQSPELNTSRLHDANNAVTYATAKRAFYRTWVYSKGTFDGADNAWGNYARQKFADTGAPSAGHAPAPPVAGAPQPGHVEGGYRFNGGNPADPHAWSKL